MSISSAESYPALTNKNSLIKCNITVASGFGDQLQAVQNFQKRRIGNEQDRRSISKR